MFIINKILDSAFLTALVAIAIVAAGAFPLAVASLAAAKLLMGVGGISLAVLLHP